MWAVGALAWELLTGRPLFGDAFSDEDVVMALLGFKPLPFEADPSLWVLFTESQVSCMPCRLYLWLTHSNAKLSPALRHCLLACHRCPGHHQMLFLDWCSHDRQQASERL